MVFAALQVPVLCGMLRAKILNYEYSFFIILIYYQNMSYMFKINEMKYSVLHVLFYPSDNLFADKLNKLVKV